MIDLQRAEELVAEFLAATKGMWERIEVAGSVRRRQPRVNDIDFVGIPVILSATAGMFEEDRVDVYPFSDWIWKNADSKAVWVRSEDRVEVTERAQVPTREVSLKLGYVGKR